MGIRSVCHYCFPCWIKDEDLEGGGSTDIEANYQSGGPGPDSFDAFGRLNDPSLASDNVRQGERYLFGLYDVEKETVENPLLLALHKFEAARSYGSPIGAAIAGIFYECAINMPKPDFNKAAKYYEEAAEHNNPLGKCLLASMPKRIEPASFSSDYKHRKQLIKEVTNTSFRSASYDPLRWLKDAADRHLVGEAIFLLGSCIEQGIGVARADPVTAFNLYRDAAKAGVKSARRTIARCYLFGVGIDRDPTAGKYWLLRAIKDSEDPEAMAVLAMNYEAGAFAADSNELTELEDVDRYRLKSKIEAGKAVNISDALATLNSPDNESGANTGSERSYSEIEMCGGFETRNEIRDNRECHFWANRSAEYGCASGMYELARCYEVGIGVLIDTDKCYELYEKSAKEGFAPAQFALACIYCSGNRNRRQDSKESHVLLCKAAEAGYTPAMISLATFYTLQSKTHVKVVESAPTNRFKAALVSSLIKLRDPRTMAATAYDADLQKAMVWWRRAAKRGSRQAQFELALCFRDARGTQVDLVKALYWMRQAAESGLPEAQLELGVLLVQDLPLNGRREGLEHDNESFYWILRAAKNGLPEAQIELAQLFIEGRYVHRNPSTAFYWFKRAAKAGHPYAQYRVGTMLMDGEIADGCVGQQGTQAEAVKWLKLASEQGWTDADSVLPVALGMANEESVKTYRLEGKYTY